MSVRSFKQILFLILLSLPLTVVERSGATPRPGPVHGAFVKLFDYDRAVPFDLKETSVTEEGGVVVRDINYASYVPAHGRMKAYLIKPKGTGKFAGVLYFHWLGNTKSNRTQFLEEAKATAQQGVVCLLIQGFFPWLEPPTEGPSDRQRVIDQTIEVRRALDLLLSQSDVDPKRVGYVGHDYGAMFGSIVAGVDKRVRAYVFIAGMGNFGDWSLKYWPATAAKGAEVYRQALKEVDPIRHISNAAPAPLLFQFANNDKYIAKPVALEFFEAASRPKEVKWYDATHDLDINSARIDRRQWLTQQLKLKKQAASSVTAVKPAGHAANEQGREV